MSIKRGSRYTLSNVIEVRRPVLGTLVKPRFLDLRQRVTGEAADDRIVTVKAHHTWANLGLNGLSDANTWWAIADLSGVVDPFTELEVGDQLRLPSRERYFTDILSGEIPHDGR